MKPLPIVAILLAISLLIPAGSAEDLTGFMLNPLDTLKTQKVYFENVNNLSYDASNDKNAIMLIHFKVPMDHTANFQIYYYNGILTGSASTHWNVSVIPPTTTTSSITLEGVTKQYNYLDTNPDYDYYLSGYAKNITTDAQGIIVYNAGYGSFDNDLAIFYETGSLPSNLIYRFDITCDVPFDIDITYAETDAVAAAADKNWLEIAYEWMALAGSIASAVYGFAVAMFYWLKFFFVDNLLMTIALYLSISMAYTASKATDIFDFFRKFFRYQRALFEFVIMLWNLLISTIANFRSIFRL